MASPNRFLETDMGRGAVKAYGLEEPQFEDLTLSVKGLIGMVRTSLLLEMESLFLISGALIPCQRWTTQRKKNILDSLSISTGTSFLGRRRRDIFVITSTESESPLISYLELRREFVVNFLLQANLRRDWVLEGTHRSIKS